jgi:hypothetical protein
MPAEGGMPGGVGAGCAGEVSVVRVARIARPDSAPKSNAR